MKILRKENIFSHLYFSTKDFLRFFPKGPFAGLNIEVIETFPCLHFGSVSLDRVSIAISLWGSI